MPKQLYKFAAHGNSPADYQRNPHPDPKLTTLLDRERSQPQRDRYAERSRRVASRGADLMDRATTDAQRAAVQAAVDKAMAERPVRHWSRSSFVEAPTNTITERGKRRLLGRLDHLLGTLYDRAKAAGEKYVQRHTDNIRRVYEYILEMAVACGKVFPEHQTIADALELNERTVRRHLEWLRQEGFLDWVRRLVWSENDLGQRQPRQSSNGYVIPDPDAETLGEHALNCPNHGRKVRPNKLQQLIDGTARMLQSLSPSRDGHRVRVASIQGLNLSERSGVP